MTEVKIYHPEEMVDVVVLGRHENHYFVLYIIYFDQEPKINHEADEFRYFEEEELKKLMKEKPQMFGDPTHKVYQQLFPDFFN